MVLGHKNSLIVTVAVSTGIMLKERSECPVNCRILQTLKNLPKVLLMFVLIFRINKDVVEVDNDANIQQISENIVHQCLECSRRVRKSEWHYIELVMTVPCSERCFVTVLRFYRNLII